MKSAFLPLGVDLGSSRVRIALSERAEGAARLVAVAARELPADAVTPETIAEPELIAAVIEDVHREIGTRERRCVFSIGAEAASLRILEFPAMSEAERRRAARFEAERIAGWDLRAVPTIVRAHAAGPSGQFGVGIARAAVLASRSRCIIAAGLRPVAADYEGCALQRAFPEYQAVLDVGYRRSTLHVFSAAGPTAVAVGGGGAEMTAAIARDLGIEESAAERRKCLLGNAGAGIAARDDFVKALRLAMARAAERVPGLRRVAATGNASRLAGLLDGIESTCGIFAEPAVSAMLASTTYPVDVVRASAQDWTLAASLAAWSFG